MNRAKVRALASVILWGISVGALLVVRAWLWVAFGR